LIAGNLSVLSGHPPERCGGSIGTRQLGADELITDGQVPPAAKSIDDIPARAERIRGVVGSSVAVSPCALR
jgi:hypothetical protein